jgi:hypothetical protein
MRPEDWCLWWIFKAIQVILINLARVENHCARPEVLELGCTLESCHVRKY